MRRVAIGDLDLDQESRRLRWCRAPGPGGASEAQLLERDAGWMVICLAVAPLRWPTTGASGMEAEGSRPKGWSAFSRRRAVEDSATGTGSAAASDVATTRWTSSESYGRLSMQASSSSSNAEIAAV